MLSIVYAAAEALSKALSKVVVIATIFLAVQQPGGTKDCNAELITDCWYKYYVLSVDCCGLCATDPAPLFL